MPEEQDSNAEFPELPPNQERIGESLEDTSDERSDFAKFHDSFGKPSRRARWFHRSTYTQAEDHRTGRSQSVTYQRQPDDKPKGKKAIRAAKRAKVRAMKKAQQTQ